MDNVVDFGLRSRRPPFAELLDWLAVYFMESDCRMKKLHFLIVTSRAYCRRSGGGGLSPVNLKIDPDNRFLWRMNHRRLESEAIRDNLLQVAGNLDRTMRGREIPLEEGESSLRRSVYFRHGHERQVEFLELFDGASVLECYRRQTSILPQQALAMTNAVVSVEHSRLLARRLWIETAASVDAETDFVRVAFEQVLGRQPGPKELARCLRFLEAQPRLFGTAADLSYSASGPECRVKPSSKPRERARENLVHVLFNHNDFVTVR